MIKTQCRNKDPADTVAVDLSVRLVAAAAAVTRRVEVLLQVVAILPVAVLLLVAMARRAVVAILPVAVLLLVVTGPLAVLLPVATALPVVAIHRAAVLLPVVTGLLVVLLLAMARRVLLLRVTVRRNQVTEAIPRQAPRVDQVARPRRRAKRCSGSASVAVASYCSAPSAASPVIFS